MIVLQYPPMGIMLIFLYCLNAVKPGKLLTIRQDVGTTTRLTCFPLLFWMNLCMSSEMKSWCLQLLVKLQTLKAGCRILLPNVAVKCLRMNCSQGCSCSLPAPWECSWVMHLSRLSTSVSSISINFLFRHLHFSQWMWRELYCRGQGEFYKHKEEPDCSVFSLMSIFHIWIIRKIIKEEW